MRKTPYESHRGQPRGLLKRSFIRKGGDMRKVTIIVLAIAFLAGSVSVFAEERWAGKADTTVTTAACKSPSFAANIGPQDLWAPNGKPVTVTVTGLVDAGSGCGITRAWYVVSDGTEAGNSVGFSVGDYGRFQVEVEVMASRSGKDKEGTVYNITLFAMNAQNTVGHSETFFVKVAHDQRKK
jgi:hypothetical protein